MTNYQDSPKDVGYPEVDNIQGKESFRWFGKNHIGFGNQTEFIKILPKAVEEHGPEKNQMKRLNTECRGRATNRPRDTYKKKS